MEKKKIPIPLIEINPIDIADEKKYMSVSHLSYECIS